MDITKILGTISDYRTKAIFADRQDIVKQLQSLIPFALLVYEYKDFPNSDEYQENRKGFYDVLGKIPSEWQPFKMPKKTGEN